MNDQELKDSEQIAPRPDRDDIESLRRRKAHTELGGLYLVPSPLGNLGDLTLRAIEILTEAQLVMAEDTRRSLKLLNHLGLKKTVLSYREQNHKRAWPRVAETLASGGVVALLTDAGSPSVSDPGAILVEEARVSGFNIIPLPGPSAVICALMASGFSADRFTFAGFLPPKKKERLDFLAPLAHHAWTLVFFEAPHRLAGSLADLAEIFKNRRALVAREMTKLHEEYLFGELPELAAEAASSPRKGEITIVVEGYQGGEEKKEIDMNRLKDLAENDPRPTKVLAAALSEESGRGRGEIYQLLLAVRRNSNNGDWS